ncbi:hypothetical protein K469DRAFT_78345 [Zopfia rhizophila CBS 207.26]|uniref:Uncharacterized protein n=1 Tax=Zopfia rhizophila CBS 207.26 TaxID=1314779 RepID=A0A6A6D813_9PEZI|nr:hypothetical protein K469DRAFT_78345 [Zopfia rhizophila CBS 207.26]
MSRPWCAFSPFPSWARIRINVILTLFGDVIYGAATLAPCVCLYLTHSSQAPSKFDFSGWQMLKKYYTYQWGDGGVQNPL